MYTSFPENAHCTVNEANINFYAKPFIHPKRRMKEHDFIYILQGEWTFGQEKEQYTAAKDNILLLSANHTHFGITPCLPNTKTMYFHVSCENVSGIDNKAAFTLDSLSDASDNPNIKKYFHEVVNCKLQGRQRQADIFFKLLLCELCEPITVSMNDIALKIQKIIHNNPERFFTNSELAQRCNISVKTAESRFKEAFNTTIHRYMLDFKVNEAVNYFEYFPKITVKEVAYNLGFYDEYHFSKQFKKIIKTSPVLYKKKCSFARAHTDIQNIFSPHI